MWQFGVSDISKFTAKYGKGYLQNGRRQITITQITEVTPGSLPVSDRLERQRLVYGFLFTENGKHLGSVRTYGSGVVFIENGIDTETKDIIAAISSAFLVKRTE